MSERGETLDWVLGGALLLVLDGRLEARKTDLSMGLLLDGVAIARFSGQQQMELLALSADCINEHGLLGAEEFIADH